MLKNKKYYSLNELADQRKTFIKPVFYTFESGKYKRMDKDSVDMVFEDEYSFRFGDIHTNKWIFVSKNNIKDMDIKSFIHYKLCDSRLASSHRSNEQRAMYFCGDEVFYRAVKNMEECSEELAKYEKELIDKYIGN